MDIYGYIYMIRNMINNKIYFGQTIRDFNHRYRFNLEKNTSNLHLKRSIKKYGIENFEIIKEFDIAYLKDELDKLEDMYVKIYETTNDKYGYNKRFGGGSRGKHIEETKQKIRESIIPITGEQHHWYGKGHLVEGSNNPRAKQVICLTTMEVFDTADEAASKYNIGSKKGGTAIIACCKGRKKIKTCGTTDSGEKLIWMYYVDYQQRTESEIQAIIDEAHTSHQGFQNVKRVICLTTSKIFNSISEAAKFYGINYNALRSGIPRKTWGSGKLPDGTQLLWSLY